MDLTFLVLWSPFLIAYSHGMFWLLIICFQFRLMSYCHKFVHQKIVLYFQAKKLSLQLPRLLIVPHSWIHPDAVGWCVKTWKRKKKNYNVIIHSHQKISEHETKIIMKWQRCKLHCETKTILKRLIFVSGRIAILYHLKNAIYYSCILRQNNMKIFRLGYHKTKIFLKKIEHLNPLIGTYYWQHIYFLFKRRWKYWI